MSYEIVYETENKIIACNGADFFTCARYDDGTFHRRTLPGQWVESRDLDYLAIGAEKHGTLQEAALALGVAVPNPHFVAYAVGDAVMIKITQ